MVETMRSPRMARLTEDLASGQPGVVEAFWEEMKERGTPLLEDVTEDVALVTFVVRRAAEEEGVVFVAGGPAGVHPETCKLTLVPGTDIWYRTVESEPCLPTTYLVSLNDTFGGDWAARNEVFVTDPLNPHTSRLNPYRDYEGFKGKTYSLVVFPSKPISPCYGEREQVAKGRVVEHRFKSEIHGSERSVYVYTPAGYDVDGEKYPLVILHDGIAYIDTVQTPLAFDNLIADGELPPMVVAYVNTTHKRMAELTCSETYAGAFAEELVPWLREQFHVTSDPKRVVIAGSSLGGLMSLYMAHRNPELYGNVIALSGSYWWGPDEEHPEWLTAQFAASEKAPLSIYANMGAFEAAKMHDGFDRFTSVLEQKGYDFTRTIFKGGHDYPCWGETILDGLKKLLG
ncbi:prolyl oligopeptidase family serine peptidase [Tumebacillus sp. ITR2]|uniref:Prolyl oligopeptidase family serine peptidase n=1 Tax=Tumebacillus amylolyticus TaxID=2801339 RepID=A0ABS1JFR3_9BACL|nr:alpha/beta hydrolase-fold protein [Tumebacillus amylolyticus]MBL0389122.1 prolyl oligopeptidase family serine peptidase [Tumebacillus amylolyticus]